jgi:hypothetical protein
MEEKKVKQNTGKQKFPASKIPLRDVLDILARVRLVYDIGHWPKGWRFPPTLNTSESHTTSLPPPAHAHAVLMDPSPTPNITASQLAQQNDALMGTFAHGHLILNGGTSCRSLWYRPRLLAPDTNIGHACHRDRRVYIGGRTMYNLLRGSMPCGDHRAITLSALPVLSRMHHPLVAAQHGMSDMSKRRRV